MWIRTENGDLINLALHSSIEWDDGRVIAWMDIGGSAESTYICRVAERADAEAILRWICEQIAAGRLAEDILNCPGQRERSKHYGVER